MRKDGEKYREQTTLRFPVALKKQLQEEAERKETRNVTFWLY